MLDLAEIALEALAGPIGGLDHDVKDGGMLHGACGTFRGAFTQGRPLASFVLSRERGLGPRVVAWRRAASLRPASATAQLGRVPHGLPGQALRAMTQREHRSRGALMRPSFVPRPRRHSENRFAPGNKRGSGAPKGACQPLPPCRQVRRLRARLRSGRQRANSGRARLPALCCGTRQGERIRRWLSSSSRVS